MHALGISRGNINMILEVAILNIRPGEGADFERAFAEAQAIIASMPGYALVRARHSRCGPG
jgi:heme-degrading monooxygenase HmoA